MVFEPHSKNKTFLLFLAGIFAVFLIIGIFYLGGIKKPEPVSCTLEAKICQDGTAVGRTGPNCEFSKCPNEDLYATWKTFRDETKGITFLYPEKLDTKYISAFDWPPQAQILNQAFSCIEGGSEIARAGRTEKRVINNREYCVTKLSEGAAGSIYEQYAYAFELGVKKVILTFSLRLVQCGNYSEAQMAECNKERSEFNIDNIIGPIAQSVQLGVEIAPITSFEECAAAGYPIMESFPEQCRTPDGKTFVRIINTASGISGSVLLGPICPVVMNPPDPQCADRPFETRLAVTTPDGTRVIKEFSSDASGKFKVDVLPGEYAIRSAAAANILPYCSSNIVKVVAGAYTKAEVSCDTGIR